LASRGRFGEHARESITDGVWLAGAMILVLSLASSLAGRFALDIDVTNLALAIERFDLREHQPHPPGYLGYVLVLRLCHRLTGMEPLDVARLVSRLFALGTLALGFLAARRFFPADRAVRRATVLLLASSPTLLYYAVDGQTHSAEAAMMAALLCVLAGRPPLGRREVILAGLLVAAGGSFRVTYFLLSIPLVLWALWPDVRRLAAVAAIAGAGTLAWLLPTVRLTGGWAAYRAASDALVGAFVRIVSPLSSEGLVEAQTANAWDAVVWTVLVTAPALAALLATARSTSEPLARRLRWLFAAVTVPSLLFYGLVLCAEAGYVLGLAPPACLLAAALLAPGRPEDARPRWRRAAAPVLALAQLAFFIAGPEKIGGAVCLPHVPELSRREVRCALLFEEVHREIAPADRVLVVSDFPELTALRQFPLHRPQTEILFVHRKKWFPAGGESWLSHATAHGWKAAPGIVLRNAGDDVRLQSPTAYDWIVVDPLATDELRAELSRQTRCPVPPRRALGEDRAQRLAARCFPGRSLSLVGRVFAFGG
jgi:hypothetical protein